MQNLYKKSNGSIYRVSEVKFMKKTEDIIDSENNRFINEWFLKRIKLKTAQKLNEVPDSPALLGFTLVLHTVR